MHWQPLQAILVLAQDQVEDYYVSWLVAISDWEYTQPLLLRLLAFWPLVLPELRILLKHVVA